MAQATDIAVDCTTGYTPGNATSPSTTCPADCMFTRAVAAAAASPETCTVVDCRNETLNDTTLCTLTSGDGDLDAATDGSCAAAGGQTTHSCT